jgi:UDP-N-acetylmuramoylalanine--D-glutamate ligase
LKTFKSPDFHTDSYHSPIVVMGMGKTGMACVKFLLQKKYPVFVMDNRPTPPGLATLQQNFPTTPYITGGFDAELLAQAAEIIISPGISLQEPTLALAQRAGVPIISEIELFARYVNAPVIAITGSNGKSTVTTLVGEMAQQAGWQVQVGGNLGTPAIELLRFPAPQLYVLELSSFQLETTYSLNPKASVVLNISEDHLDRYANFQEYVLAKRRIYQGTGVLVVNGDDPHVLAMLPPNCWHLSFSVRNNRGDFRVCQYRGECYLVGIKGYSFTPLLATKQLRVPGTMMQANALAALALGDAVGLPMSAMLDALQTFRGLPHRFAWVAEKQGVNWYNDSKGTNVGATIAAIESLEKPGQVILIAGGQGKGADFTPLAEQIIQHCRACLLIGQDAPLLAELLTDQVPWQIVDSMEEAVKQAAKIAQTGDAVLLSPACASFDMFKNYEHRGQVFEECVNNLLPEDFLS